MIAYASRTGTKRNLDELRNHGWRLMVTPACTRTEGFPYALDNGAWSAYCQGGSFDEKAFLQAVEKLGDRSDFIVIPDIVAAGLKSLEFSLEWIERLEGGAELLLLAVQDGMKPEHVEPFIGKRTGIFVGGTTDFKLDTLPLWAKLAHDNGTYIHVGRVNTMRRIRYCSGFGVHSFDGTSASMYSRNVSHLDFARRQSSLDFEKVTRNA